MSKQANPTVIGAFVLGALVLVVVAVLVFSSGAWIRERVALVTYFTTTVQGLNTGSQVLFQGVPIGQVTNIGVDYVAARESFRIPVSYEIWPKQMQVLGGGAHHIGVRELIQKLVNEQGLRAKLESVSFVTGQYVITLALEPNAPPRQYELDPKGPVRVPPTPATRDQVEEMLNSIDAEALVNSATGTLQALETLLRSSELRGALQGLEGTLSGTRTALAQLNEELTPVLQRTRRTLEEYGALAVTLEARIDPMATRIEQRIDTVSEDVSTLARNLDARIEPVTTAATSALNEAGSAMRAVSDLTGEGSATRYELTQLLSEATRAAQSLRSLAEYLERHPEALLQGKR